MKKYGIGKGNGLQSRVGFGSRLRVENVLALPQCLSQNDMKT